MTPLRFRRTTSLLTALLVIAAICGCGGDALVDADTEVDGDAEADGDVALDGDADMDIDSDSDGDVDGDIDGDTDVDTDGDGDGDADAEVDGDIDRDVSGDADIDVDHDTPPVVGGCLEGTFSPYFGNLHAHTSNSDGDGSPEDAFAMARDEAGLDIMVVTDHLEQLYELWGTPSGEYRECLDAAAVASVAGEFVADCGFEYGSGFGLSGSTGHNNVFFSPSLFPMLQLDFHNFYDSLVGCPTCLGQFNHPRDEAGQTWNDWEYHPDVDERLNLFELNGAGPTWETFFDALDAGWHVSPMLNQDNHSANWGTANDSRSGFFLSELSGDALALAIQQRRTFATFDRNASIRLIAQGTCWMGSILTGLSSVALDIEASDGDLDDGIAAIELYGPGQTLIERFDCAGDSSCAVARVVDVTASTYVVARALEVDGDMLVSAPIWLEP